MTSAVGANQPSILSYLITSPICEFSYRTLTTVSTGEATVTQGDNFFIAIFGKLLQRASLFIELVCILYSLCLARGIAFIRLDYAFLVNINIAFKITTRVIQHAPNYLTFLISVKLSQRSWMDNMCSKTNDKASLSIQFWLLCGPRELIKNLQLSQPMITMANMFTFQNWSSIIEWSAHPIYRLCIACLANTLSALAGTTHPNRFLLSSTFRARCHPLAKNVTEC